LERLLAGSIERAVQERLLELAGALTEGDDAKVGRACSELVKCHWRDHRDWLKDLRHLLSLR